MAGKLFWRENIPASFFLTFFFSHSIFTIFSSKKTSDFGVIVVAVNLLDVESLFSIFHRLLLLLLLLLLLGCCFCHGFCFSNNKTFFYRVYISSGFVDLLIWPQNMFIIVLKQTSSLLLKLKKHTIFFASFGDKLLQNFDTGGSSPYV